MGKRTEVLKHIKKYTAEMKLSVAALVIVSLLAIPAMMISPRFFQSIVDEVIVNQRFEMFKYAVLGLLLVYIIRFALDGLNLYFSNKLLNKFTFSIRLDVWHKYLGAKFEKYERKDTGDLKMRLYDDVDSLGNFLKQQIVEYWFNIITLIFSLTFALIINPELTLYCVLIIPFVFLINYLIGKGTQRVNDEMRAVEEKYYTFEHNSLQYWKEMKAQGTEKVFIKRFGEFRDKLAKLGYRKIRYWFYTEIFNDFKANYLTKVLIYIIGSFYVMNEQITIGMLIMFAEYFGMLFSSIDAINSRNVALRVSMPYYERIFEILDEDGEESADKVQLNFKGNISMQNVSFAYEAGLDNTLKDLCLSVNNKDYIAVIGRSGCGKTTAAKVLLGLYEPREGEILYEGIKAGDIDFNSVYRNTGAVMQDNYLFNMSIRENLQLAKEEASEEELINACRKAGIYDFVKDLPSGLDTIIGEHGIKLSGGQKQKLSIAQALLRKPKLIIFDEATSSLDKASEDLINNSIYELSGDCTVIVITHKPLSVMRAEKVFIMDNGRIIASGTHEELKGSNNYYDNLTEGA